ncbi:uroporphyrinogen decarboxylase family protein [Pseudomonas protegens]|uniref:uroporphyrinogen decarboxylase family protein n=1 Tax=Pseudomonas protegens TaxID=380021 RepID=UPI0031F5BA61
MILFTKGGGLRRCHRSSPGPGCPRRHRQCFPATGRRRVGSKVSLQGNMDPTVLYANPQAIRSEVARILASYGKGSGHVFNLGHGITPEVKPEHAGAFLEAVHELSAQYHE